MSDNANPARPWKIATAVLGVTCVALAVLLVQSGRIVINPSQASGKISSRKAEPARVSLRNFQGPEDLVGEAKKKLGERLSAAGDLTFTGAGVKGVAVDTAVTDRTRKGEGATEIEIRVQLLVSKQPGNKLLTSISAIAAADLGGDASENFVERTKLTVLRMAADSTFDDLVNALEDTEAHDSDED